MRCPYTSVMSGAAGVPTSQLLHIFSSRLNAAPRGPIFHGARYTGPMTLLLRMVYIFLSCIQIVVIGKPRAFLWITPYTSIRSTVYVYRKHRDEMLAGVDDSSFRMG